MWNAKPYGKITWKVEEGKENVCIIFRDRHCALVNFGESLPDNMERNSALHNHEFFLMTAMRDIAHKLGISSEEFYDSGTYEADVSLLVARGLRSSE